MSENNVRQVIIGFTCGSFDLLHAGHVMFLEECRQHCTRFIVGLHVDPSIERPYKNKPVQGVLERYLQLNAMAAIDVVIPYETEHDVEMLINHYPFDIRFLGSDYRDKVYTGKDICERKDIKVVYVPRLHQYSSTELRRRIINAPQNIIN